MSSAAILTLVLQSLVFAVWAAAMFVTLFRLAREAAARRAAAGQNYITGIGQTFATFGDFLTAPRWRRNRRVLGGLTLLLIATILGRFAFLG